MREISVIINGKKLKTSDDKTILQVVTENKIDKIPTLCNDERVEPYGSCFLCVVEVEGVNRLLPSCATKVKDGMVIKTNSKKVVESRKTALELILSNHYADCIGPCTDNCPAHVDAQGYIALISMGKNIEALKLIKKNNPLPLSIGRVCVRDCEIACRRNIVDETVGINYLKRYVADIDSVDMWTPEIKEEKQIKVAVVGGGPSGLSCAYFLRLKGYQVTIFEKLPKLGGMLRYGIPEYRLPKSSILDVEINWIVGLGINVKTNSEMGKDFSSDSLLKDGYAAVYLAVGAQDASSMRLKFEDETEGVFKGIDFLKNFQLNGSAKLSGTVGIVGGGNTAIDAARTAVRLGADKVMILYRRSEKEMPAHEAEIEAAKEEGIEINILTLPINLLREGKKLKGVECIRMELKEGVSGERPKPVPIEGTEFSISLDFLISAIGQKVDISFSNSERELKLEKWGTIIVNDETMETSKKKIFAGGDAVSGPFTAISSIAHGEKAAYAIERYLEFGIAKGFENKFYSFKHRFNEVPVQELFFATNIKKEKMRELEPDNRKKSFKEVELGFTDGQAQNEVKRCLECGCSEYYDCELRKYSDEYGINIDDFIGEVRKYKPDTDHPFITIDPNKCINCGKCVRICSEILQISALGFVNRGFKSVVKPAMEKSLLETNCISCGNCVDVCPTGAISEKFPFKIHGTLPKENHESICNFCSVGCKINYKVVDNDIFYVSNSTDTIQKSHNEGYLCVKGKFGHRYLTSGNRLIHPSIKKGKKMIETTWEEAIKYASDNLKKIIKKYGTDSIAVFCSPKMSNEELYLLSKFTRKTLDNNNISSFSNLLYGYEQNSLDESIGITASTLTLNDIDSSDIIVLINSGLSSENLIVEQKIKAAKKGGTKLIIINSTEIKLTKFSDLWIDTRKGTNTVLMNGIIREIIERKKIKDNSAELPKNEINRLKEIVSDFNSEKVIGTTGINISKYEKLISMISDEKQKIVFIYNIDSKLDKSKNDLKSIANFQILTNRIFSRDSGIIILRDYSNSQGVFDMGVSPHYLPGQVTFHETEEIEKIGKEWKSDLVNIFKPVDIYNKLSKGEIKAALIFNENPYIDSENLKLLSNLEFLLVNQMFYDLSSREADVILPASSYIEQDGTFTNSDTRVQQVKSIFKPRQGLRNWEIILKLINKFDREGFDFRSAEDIFMEIKKVNRLYRNIKYNKCWNIDYFNREPIHKRVKFSKIDSSIETFEQKKNTILFSEEYFDSKIRYNLKKY